MSDYYILQDKEPIQVSLLEWAMWLDNTFHERIVDKDLVNGKKVSTVFLGLDHSYEKDQIHIFETMVFEGRNDIYCERYATWEQAEEGHQRAIQWVKDGCKDE